MSIVVGGLPVPSSWNPLHGDEVDARQVGHPIQRLVTASASSRGWNSR